jgi:tetratricopeptide (TPR) repeat protein
MILLYAALGIIVIGIIMFRQTKKEKDSPYFKIRKKLEEDLQQANFTGEWKKRQEINLQILWLDAIKKVEVEVKDLFGAKNDESESSLLSKLTEEEIRFPTKWKLKDLHHNSFVTGIIDGYAATLAENDYKAVVYKPDNILPYPKHIIQKAFYYVFDELNSKDPLYAIKEKDKYAAYLNAASHSLYNTFVDTGNNGLPKETLENVQRGTVFYNKQPASNAEDEFSMIDWRDEFKWIAKGTQYVDDGNFDAALVCLKKAKEINPDSKDIRIIEGLFYKSMAEYSKEKGNYELELSYMKKAAELGNEEASKWLKQN